MSAAEPLDAYKAAAAEAAALQLTNGMVVGLGSGSTALLTVDAIGRRVKEGLRITGIPTSDRTAEQARKWEIPLATLEEFPRVDLAMDGADEVEAGTLQLIKGGGGNLLREKMVAVASARFLIVADERKLVEQLGSRTFVPVDVVPFGWSTTVRRLEFLGARPMLRLDEKRDPFITDGGHYVLDCTFGPIKNPRALQAELDGVVGVVEHGLFLDIATEVLLGGPGGVRSLRRNG